MRGGKAKRLIKGVGIGARRFAVKRVNALANFPQADEYRDRAREIRMDFKRHSKTPQWDLVRKMVAEPLLTLSR